MRLVLVVLISLVFFAGSCSQKGVKPDEFMSAAQAGDYTALIEGCGNQLTAGYTYCRKTEGQSAAENIFFVAPKTNCLGEGPCVTFKVFFPNGSPSYGGSVPRGTTRVAIPWSVLVKKDRFEIEDRGFWQYIYDIRWLDLAGREQLTRSFGEIRMRVVPSGYVSLSEIPEDKSFVWSWSDNGTIVRMTTGARTYVGRRQ